MQLEGFCAFWERLSDACCSPLPLVEPRGSCRSWPLPLGFSDNLRVQETEWSHDRRNTSSLAEFQRDWKTITKTLTPSQKTHLHSCVTWWFVWLTNRRSVAVVSLGVQRVFHRLNHCIVSGKVPKHSGISCGGNITGYRQPTVSSSRSWKVYFPTFFISFWSKKRAYRTYGEGNHGLVWVGRELHPVHNGPDGIEGVVGHVRGLHFPSLPAAFGFGRIQSAVHVDVVEAVGLDSHPVQAPPVDSVLVPLNQERLLIHPGTGGVLI